MQPIPIGRRDVAQITELGMEIQVMATDYGHRDIAELARRICQLNQPPPSDVVVFTKKFKKAA